MQLTIQMNCHATKLYLVFEQMCMLLFGPALYESVMSCQLMWAGHSYMHYTLIQIVLIHLCMLT